MKKNNETPSIYALRSQKVIRPILEEELLSIQPFEKKGEGEFGKKGIIFIHGFSATTADFNEWGHAITKEGYSAIVLSLPGHGGHYSDLDKVNRQDWLKAVEKAFDKMSSEWRCEKIILCGLSLGASLALQLSPIKKTINKLILLAPAVYSSLRFKTAKNFILPALKLIRCRYFMAIAGDVKKKDGYILAYKKISIRALKELYSCMKETRRILKNVKTDTLIFQSRIDHSLPSLKANNILKKISAENKELVWLDNSYHEIPNDGDSEKVFQRILEEITKL